MRASHLNLPKMPPRVLEPVEIKVRLSKVNNEINALQDKLNKLYFDSSTVGGLTVSMEIISLEIKKGKLLDRQYKLNNYATK